MSEKDFKAEAWKLASSALAGIGVCVDCGEEAECRNDEDCDHCNFYGEVLESLEAAYREGVEAARTAVFKDQNRRGMACECSVVLDKMCIELWKKVKGTE